MMRRRGDESNKRVWAAPTGQAAYRWYSPHLAAQLLQPHAQHGRTTAQHGCLYGCLQQRDAAVAGLSGNRQAG